MMTVLNLPREERFKTKWTMILPGPTEPKVNINTLVDNLMLLWGGIPIAILYELNSLEYQQTCHH